MRPSAPMADRTPTPDADRQEQLEPAGPGAAADPIEGLAARTEAPEADVLEQRMPSGLEPGLQLPSHSRERRAHVPEADAMEQAMPADHEIFEDDE